MDEKPFPTSGRKSAVDNKQASRPSASETPKFSASEVSAINARRAEKVANQRLNQLGLNTGAFQSLESQNNGSPSGGSSTRPLSYVDVLNILPNSQTADWRSPEDAVKWLEQNRPDLLERSPELLEVRDRLEEEESSGFLKGILGGGPSSD